MRIHDVLCYGPIVYATDPDETGCEWIVTWNTSCVFNLWVNTPCGWDGIDCRTLGAAPTTVQTAESFARVWIDLLMDGGEP